MRYSPRPAPRELRPITHYQREAANRNARRRNTVKELSASLRECLAILDDARQKAGDLQELVDPYQPELGLRWRQGRRAARIKIYTGQSADRPFGAPRG
jgi:hypothetical protein